MNALTLLVVALLVYALAYRYYSSFLLAKVLACDDAMPTPAHVCRNDFDYKPTNRWVLFGHHFAAIAGAGPLVGPVLAAQFGYLPGYLWILIGSVLAGAVHDMVVLCASMHYDGLSLTQVARHEVGPVTGGATALALFFIVITALAGFCLIVVNALSESAWGVFSIATTIPTALLMGWYMNHLRPGKVAEASVLGVAFILLGVFLGHPVAQSAWAHYFIFSRNSLIVILAVYGLAASALPVWLLLCPRDYLSSYMKLGTVFLMALGILWVRPSLAAPALSPFIHGGGPIVPGPVWPFVCITIACGAISGFHCLISAGTTPKMIDRESDMRFIGYGAMLTEGVVSIMALIAATVLAPGDYFAINVPPAVFAKLGLIPAHISELSAAVGENLAGRTGGAVSLAVGMAQILSNMPGMNRLVSYWYHFAIMFEALFVLTALDTGTRVARYILQEILGRVYKPFARTDRLAGVLLTGAVVSGCWGAMVYMGNITTIWPMFGVANQLLATLALAVGTTFIMKRSEPRYALTTFVPFVFMLGTTVTAGVLNIFSNYLPRRDFSGFLNAGLSVVMIALVLFIAATCAVSWLRILKSRRRPDHPGLDGARSESASS